jgi:3-isopropylmalate dehydrogenase
VNFKIAVLPGDGVGPEIVVESIKVLKAVGEKFGHQFDLTYGLIGGVAIDEQGTALAPETIEICKKSDAVLLGAVGDPKWDKHPDAKVRPEDGLLAIRKDLGLFANLRPVFMYPMLINTPNLKPEVVKGVDFIVVRELTGGLYFGRPKKRWTTSRGRRAVDSMSYRAGTQP